jgi:hypothetical protein
MLEKIKGFYWTAYSFERTLDEVKIYRGVQIRGLWFFPFLVEPWQGDYIEILEQLTAMERGLA